MNKAAFLDKFFWPATICIGLALAGLVGYASFDSQYTKISQRFSNTVEYVKTQSLTYDSFNDSSTTKSLMRSIENASQLARDIENDKGAVTEANLAEHASDLRFTAAIVLAVDGALVAEHSTDGVGYAQLKDVLCDAPSLDVAKYPSKVYTVRVPLEDGSYVDVGCASRLDAPGVVVSAYHTSAEFADRYTLTLQSMLEGYEISESGSIVIEGDGKVVASNVAESHDSSGVHISSGDNSIVQSIKSNCEPGKLALISDGSSSFFGTYGKARDYYVYTYTDAWRTVHYVGSNVAIALVLYAAIVVLFATARRRFESRYLNELVEQERHYSQQLKESAVAAQSANNAKTEFLQRMSHDIRTPINGIRGMVEVGNAYADNLEKQKECREKVWTASGLLLDLVNEVLDMSKLESGEVEFDMRPVNLTKLNEEVCQMLERQAQEHQISIICNQEGIQHPYVVASALHVKRLLMNIAGNSVKYNKTGGNVWLTCKETAFVDGIATYQITIADDGIGMSEEFQKHLFEPFARENQEAGFKSSGTGLGTVIAKQLAEQMGGSLSCQSALGEGTSFTITLSFEVTDELPASERGTSADAPITLEGMRILLVEDNDLNTEIAQFVLDSAGAQVVHAPDGETAVKVFGESVPGEFDAVLMDIMMPGIDGYEATRAIRRLERDDAATVPIIAMSANAFADDRRRSRQAGMDEHLAKPLDSAELVKVLAKLAGSSR